MAANQDSHGLEFAYFEVDDLELRQRGRSLRGSFRYNRTATVSDRGRRRKERIGPRAFRFAVEDDEREVHLLAGHSFNRPLASKRGGTLKLRDSPEGLFFEATLPAEGNRPSWVEDAARGVESGLIRGVSPGFRVPPASAVPGAERLVPEAPGSDVLVRVISQAVLHELSLVSRPAFDGTSVNLRSLEAAYERADDRRYWALWL